MANTAEPAEVVRQLQVILDATEGGAMENHAAFRARIEGALNVLETRAG